MKTLSFARPLLLMMIGLPGAGKSFFATQFATTFNTPLVSADRVRFELFAHPAYSAEEHNIISRILGNELQELLKTKSTILIDGNCNTAAERKQLAAAAKKYGYESLIVWVQTDEATAQQRATRRKPSKDDKTFSHSLTDSQFTGIAKRFSHPQREPYVVISGKHSYGTQAKMVLRKLANTRTDSPGTPPRVALTAKRPTVEPQGREIQPRRPIKIIR